MSDNLKTTLVTLAVLLWLAACQRAEVLMERRLTPPAWRYTDSLTVPYTNSDTSTPKSLQLLLQVSKAYPYQNIHVRLRVKPPQGAANVSQREFLLAGEGGEWLAEPNFSGNYPYELELLPLVKFSQLGTYQFTLVQLMRQDTLPGVVSVGLNLQQAQPE